MQGPIPRWIGSITLIERIITLIDLIITVIELIITLIELINCPLKYDLQAKKTGRKAGNRRIPVAGRVFTIQYRVFGIRI